MLGVRSGCWLEGDAEAECLELSNVLALLGLGVNVPREVVRAEVVEARVRLGEQVPDDDQHGAAARDDGLLLPATSRDPAEALTQEGVGLGCGYGVLTQDPGQVAIAEAGGPVALVLAGRGVDARGEPRP